MQKRLFITTGSISLINALSIIEQNKSGDFDDTLVVISFSMSDFFINTNKKIATLHNFSNIHFLKKEKELFSLFNINDFDYIYSATLSKLYKNLKHHKNLYMFDEGPGSVNTNLLELKNLKGIYSVDFLNKLTIFNAPENVERYTIDGNIFNKISKDVIKLFGEDEKLKTSKNVLFIGHYVYRKSSNQEAVEFYKKYIDYFLNLNCNIYLKIHPRDTDNILPIIEEHYKNNSNFHVFKTRLPIEIYDYNFDMVIGAYSGTLVSLAHYRKIPCIQLPFYELYGYNFGIGYKKFFALYDTYTPKFADMEDVLSKSKEQIWAKYEKIIAQKKPLQENKELTDIITYKNSFINLLSCLFTKKYLPPPSSLKRKIKFYIHYDFYLKIHKYLKKEKINVEIFG